MVLKCQKSNQIMESVFTSKKQTFVSQHVAKYIQYCIAGKFDKFTVDDACVKLNPVNINIINIFISAKFVGPS